MNPIMWEMLFSKKGSLFTFGRGTKRVVFEGTRGFKTWKDTFIVKEDGKYTTVEKNWEDEDEIYE